VGCKVTHPDAMMFPSGEYVTERTWVDEEERSRHQTSLC